MDAAMRAYSNLGRDRARSLRKSFTDAELKLWRLLKNRSLKNFKFRRQHPVGPYIADFACLERKLIIELDGGQHAEKASYDSRRTTYLESTGYRVIRFWDNDVLTNTESVVQAIHDALDHPSP
jgi:very-short-patch-repair endonuclease